MRLFVHLLLASMLSACVFALDEPVDSEPQQFNPPDGGPGADADVCTPASPCEVTAPSPTGECIRTSIPGCTLCDANGVVGTSRDGQGCCTGCWAGRDCYPNDDWAACGRGGALCVSCLPGDHCVDGVCGLLH